jgi:type IV pilus assembly protein PilM
VFSRFVRLPPVGPDKVDQIVRYEAQQNVPFPINEVVWDYQLIGGIEGEVDVMLAAIKADISESVCRAIMAAGLEPEIIDVAPLALYNAVRFNYNELPPCTMVVDIGARSTDLIFIEEGRVFNRSIPVGGNTITRQIMKEFDQPFADADDIKKNNGFVAFGGAYEAPKSEVADKVSKSVRSVMTRLHAEIGRSVNFYRTQQEGTGPSLILLTGGSSVMPYMDRFLEEKLGVAVEFLNPFQNISVGAAIPDDSIASNAHLLGEVVGTALRKTRSCPIEINLLPESVRAERAMKRKIPFFIAAAYCLVAVAAIWCAFFLKLGNMAEERLAVVSGRLQVLESTERRLRSVESEIDDVSAKLESLKAVAEKKSEWVEVLQAIHEKLPKSMWITNLALKKPAPSQAADEARAATRRSARGAEPEDAATASAAAKPVIELAGLAYADIHESGQSVTELLESLRAHEMFAESSEITWLPTRNPDEHLLRFKIDLVLEESVAL